MKTNFLLSLTTIIVTLAIATAVFAAVDFEYDEPFPASSPRVVAEQFGDDTNGNRIWGMEITSSSTLTDYVFVQDKYLPRDTNEGDVLTMNFMSHSSGANTIDAIVRDVSQDTVTLGLIGVTDFGPQESPLMVSKNYIKFNAEVGETIYIKFQPFMTLEQWCRLHC